ncbi:radial spoke head-like protein 14 [Lamellibrachia satsuma]|nr:radial spoke head-like protein 14 [Lamellibrachia satsuma]
MNRELLDTKLLTRQRAIMSLCDYLHDPEHIASAIREGLVKTLKTLLVDDDETIRQKATECLFVMAGHTIGRDAFIDYDIIIPLSTLFNDPKDIVRKNTHLAFEMVSHTGIGAEGIVDAKLVPQLVDKLTSEHDEIKTIILDTLHFCLKVNTTAALESDAMSVFTFLLEHPQMKIQAKAARDIMALSVPLDGKNKAVEVKCMPLLVKLLDSNDVDVRANAAGAIMMITITTKGKYTALEAEAILPLVILVDDTTSEVKLNALKALTCLAETPEGRKALLDHVEKIQQRTSDMVPAVVKAALIAIRVITWQP